RPRSTGADGAEVGLGDWPVRRRRAGLVAAGAVTMAAGLSARAVQFGDNLLPLEAGGTGSVRGAGQLLQGPGVCGCPRRPAGKRDAFAKLRSVADVDSALLFLPEQQSAKLKILRDTALIVGPLRMAAPPRLDMARLLGALEGLGRRLDIFIAEAGPAGADSGL